MRTLKSIMVLGLALSTFTATEAAKLTFKVTNPNEKVKVRLTFSQSGEQKEVAIDAAGNGNIEITGFTPQYVTMQYTRGRRTLYLDPNQDLTLSFDSDNMWRNTTFEGAGAAINTYLGSKELQSLGMPDMKMQEAALIHKGDSLYAANCQVLEAAKLPADFTTQEKIRLQFYTYYYFSKYALYHPHFGKDDNYIPSKAYYEKLEAITPINASLLALKEYKAFLPDAISAFSNKGKTVASSSTEQSVNYVDATIQDEKVAEFLIDQFVYNFVDNNGLDEADGLIVLFRKHVKDTKSIEKFNALCTKWEKLRSGNPSAASFSYPDINGKTISLADLKGKYIYIDGYLVWPLPWRTSCVKGIGREICRKGYSFCQPVMRQEQKGMGEHGNKGSTERDPVTHGNRQDLYGCLPHQRHSPFYPAGSGWQNHLCQYDPSVRSQDSREVQ